MTENTETSKPANMKKAWMVYALIVFIVILILVFFVASDNEERLFFTLMAAAGSYVFRPTDRFMKKKFARFIDSEDSTSDK